MSTNDDGCGWLSDLPFFYYSMSAIVVSRLVNFVLGASAEQATAWPTHVPVLQEECRAVTYRAPFANSCTAIVKYQLPYDLRHSDLDLRHSDLIVPERAAVGVAEPKGDLSRTGVDEVLAHARDLPADGRPTGRSFEQQRTESVD